MILHLNRPTSYIQSIPQVSAVEWGLNLHSWSECNLGSTRGEIAVNKSRLKGRARERVDSVVRPRLYGVRRISCRCPPHASDLCGLRRDFAVVWLKVDSLRSEVSRDGTVRYRSHRHLTLCVVRLEGSRPLTCAGGDCRVGRMKGSIRTIIRGVNVGASQGHTDPQVGSGFCCSLTVTSENLGIDSDLGCVKI